MEAAIETNFYVTNFFAVPARFRITYNPTFLCVPL
jgi:hypothetical protein